MNEPHFSAIETSLLPARASADLCSAGRPDRGGFLASRGIGIISGGRLAALPDYGHLSLNGPFSD
jgi:hypothetical protein